MHGKQGFVGRDHVLTPGNRIQQKPLGGIVSADQFDDDVEGGIFEHLTGIGGQNARRECDSPVRRDVEVRDFDKVERDA